MTIRIQMQDIRRAWDARDPALVQLVEALAVQPDEEPETPVRKGALTFHKYWMEISSTAFRRRDRAEQAHYRVEQMKALEAPDAEVPLPERRKLHEFLVRS